MKNQRFTRQTGLLFATICSIFAIASSFAAEIPTNGLVAYFPFDGTAEDAGPNHFPIATTSLAATADRFGNTNSALAFDGVQSIVNVGNPAEFNFATNFALACWVKLDTTQINEYIIAKYNFGVTVDSYGLGTANGSQPYGFVQTSTGGYKDLPVGARLDDGQWHALAMTYDASSGLALYRDGALAGFIVAQDFPAFANDAPLTIGAAASGQFFQGAIDDVRIYNRALSASEIAALGPPPQITIAQQPNGYTTPVNAPVTLKVLATTSGSSEPLLYQWFRDGQPTVNATNSTVTVSSTVPVENKYFVRLFLGDLQKDSSEVTVAFSAGGEAKLLARYTFDQDSSTVIADETGAFPGEPHNIDYVTGRVGSKAAAFNGTNSYIRIPYPASPVDLAGTLYTISWWMKWLGMTSTEQVFWMGDGLDTYGGYAFSFLSSSFTDLHNNGTSGTGWTGAYRPSTNWQHIALVWNGSTRALYINGVLSNSIPTTVPIVSERDDALYIGARNGTNNFLLGMLDDFRIYSYALASDEIAQLAAAPATPLLSIARNPSGLILSWGVIDSTTTFRVEYSSSIGVDASWLPASGVPQLSGQTYTLTQSLPATIRFYRLRKL